MPNRGGRAHPTSDSELSEASGSDVATYQPSTSSQPAGHSINNPRVQRLNDMARRRREAMEAQVEIASNAASAGSSPSDSTSARPSRTVSAMNPPPTTVAGSSRGVGTARPGRSAPGTGAAVVDLTMSSDEDDNDVIFDREDNTNRRRPVAPAAPIRQRLTNEEAQRRMQAHSQAVAAFIRRREEENAARQQRVRPLEGAQGPGTVRSRPRLVDHSDAEASYGESDEDEPVPDRPRIRPGGAILRRNGETINYRFDDLGDGRIGASRTQAQRQRERDEDEYHPDPEEGGPARRPFEPPGAPRMRRLPHPAPTPARANAVNEIDAARRAAREQATRDRLLARYGPEDALNQQLGIGGAGAAGAAAGGGGGLFGGFGFGAAAVQALAGAGLQVERFPAHIVNLLGALGGGGGPAAGPAGHGGLVDAKALCDAVVFDTYPEPPAGSGVTHEFNVEELAPIEMRADGSMVEARAPILGCGYCTRKLLASSDYRDENDKVWALRCGHLIHQSCLQGLSTPSKEEQDKLVPSGLQVLGAAEEEEEAASKKRRRTRRGHVRKKDEEKAEAEKHLEWEYACPVKNCGRVHVSYMKGEEGGWKQRAGRGALNVFL